MDQELEGRWKAVVGAWEDATTHAAFLEYCQRTGTLAEAAARYKGMSGDHVRGEDAQKRLQAVALLAMQSLEAERSDVPVILPRWVVAGAAVALAALATYAVARAFGG